MVLNYGKIWKLSINILLSFFLLTSVIGLILIRLSLLRFILCYEILFMLIFLSLPLFNATTYGMLLVIYLIWLSTFEAIIALTLLLL